MYSVVCFLGENSLSVVPRSWLHNVGKDVKCRWPAAKVLKGKALTKAIEMRAPAKPDWEEYDVKVLVETDNYEKARKKCKKAEDCTSDLATTDTDARRKPRAPARIESSSDDASSESDGDISQMAPKKKKKMNNAVDCAPPPVTPQMPVVGKSTATAVSGANGTPHIQAPTRSRTPFEISTPVRFSSPQTPSNIRKSSTTSEVTYERFSSPQTPSNTRKSSTLSEVTYERFSSPQTPPNIRKSSTPSEVTYERFSSPQTPSNIRKSSTPSEVTYESFSSAQTPSSTRRSSTTSDAAHERDRRTFELLEVIHSQVKQNTLYLQSLSKMLQVMPTGKVDMNSLEDFNLPLKSEADFTKTEDLLADKQKQKCLTAQVTHLCSLGGFGPKDVVERMLSALVDNSLARSYNWAGKGFKVGISKTQLVHVIKDAARNLSIKEADTEDVIKKWLKGAGDRDGGRKKREDKKKDMEKARRLNVLDDIDLLVETLSQDTDDST